MDLMRDVSVAECLERDCWREVGSKSEKICIQLLAAALAHLSSAVCENSAFPARELTMINVFASACCSSEHCMFVIMYPNVISYDQQTSIMQDIRVFKELLPQPIMTIAYMAPNNTATSSCRGVA